MEDGVVLGLSYDKIIVLPAHLLCIPLAVLFHVYTQNGVFRKEISAGLGILLVLWCYKWSSLQLFVQWIISYIMYKIMPPHSVGKYTFLITVGHVLLANASSIYYEYGEFPINYINTLMVGTMKMSSFAFSVEDAQKKPSDLKDYQRKEVVREDVTLLEHFCYYFSFLGLLFGPFIFYNDHKRFMLHRPNSVNYRHAFSTMIYGLACAVIFLLGIPDYDVMVNASAQVLSGGFVYRHWILFVTMFLARCKYYFVWLTAQSVCLFAGFDSDETKDKPVTETVRPLRIELATSLKEFIDNWNIFTAKWLRFAVHTRVPRHKVLMTFLVSAIWHGFYPGYLLMFVPLAFYTVVGQRLHKSVWPHFQTPTSSRIAYLVVTWIGTTVTVMFNGTAFQLIFFSKIMAVQSRLYFYPHIIALLVFLLVKSPLKPTSTRKQSNQGDHDTSSQHINNNGVKHYD